MEVMFVEENKAFEPRSERSGVQGRLLNVQELSAYLSLPVSTIYTWASLGRIPGVVRLGRALRFDRAAIDEWVEKRRES